MNKRGQVFILAAILLAVILFSLSAIRNKSEQEQIKGDFELLSENYKIEASKLINAVVKQSEIDPHEAFKSFSMMFTSYAKGKNPEYGLIYILSFEDKIQVANFLNRGITVQGCGAGGAEYSVSIPPGFDKINANLNFEGFNIETGLVPTDLQFDCADIPSLSGDNQVSVPCAFLYPGEAVTEIDLAVVIDSASYKSCIKKGVPEIMQVSIMKQGEQARVSAVGSCISDDFCAGLEENQCEVCGKDVCFLWPEPLEPLPCEGFERFCLNKYTYPSRDPQVGGCSATCDKACLGDKVYYKDTCENPIGLAPNGNCESQGEVCRNAQCCVKDDTRKCDDEKTFIGMYSSCDTFEGVAEDCGDTKICYDQSDGLSEITCCIKEDHLECYDEENSVYWYSNCQTTSGDYIKGILELACSEDMVCRDRGDNLPAEILEDAVCCIQDFEVKCFEGDVHTYSSCGTNEGLKEDCGTAGCEDGQCNAVAYKQFNCKCEKFSGDGWSYAELQTRCKQLCGENAICKEGTIGGSSEDRYCMCYYEYSTGCLENPSCGSNTYIGEQACTP